MKKILLSFIRRNWFKMAIVGFLVFLATKKDLNFHINLNNPEPGQPFREEIPTQQIKQESPREILSEQVTAEQEPVTKRFNLQPFLPWGRKSKVSTTSTLEQLSAIDAEQINDFIKRFAHVAIKEKEKYGIPASVIIGNALLLSKAGQAPLAQEEQNFFQLPCTPDWQGTQVNFGGGCYRTYETAWLSFRDHSLYLSLIKQSANLSDADDYRAWAKALHAAGFGNQKRYDRQLLQLIEDLELTSLDNT